MRVGVRIVSMHEGGCVRECVCGRECAHLWVGVAVQL